jgi:hypothetical protein
MEDSMRTRKLAALVTALMALSLAVPSGAVAHIERTVDSPPRPGTWPDEDRVQRHVVVCKRSSKPTAAQKQNIARHIHSSSGKAQARWIARRSNWRYNKRLWSQCAFHNIQAAINSVKGHTDILVMPGEYKEKPSRKKKEVPADNSNGSYSYELQKKHPNAINLIAIIGKKNITLEGTGFSRNQVVIDADFQKHVGIRADRADGFIARNFVVEHAVEHGLYTMDSDGYLYDNVAGRYSGEYQLFGYASDHGLIENCAAVGGGDSGIYVGGAPKSGRINTIVQNCKVHHNVMGFSGTNSNWVVIRNNDFYDNATGIIVDAESDHPNYNPQYQHIVGNRIWDNNFNVYSRRSNVKPIGFTRDTIHVPVGTAIVMVSFSDSLIRGNWIWNNHAIGVGLSSLEATDQGSKSNYDTIIRNWFTKPGGKESPNGIDLFWDGIGEGNCWGGNWGASSTPTNLPKCSSDAARNGIPGIDQPNPENIALSGGLVVTDADKGELVCNSTGTQPCPSGPGPKEGDNTREGKDGGGY